MLYVLDKNKMEVEIVAYNNESINRQNLGCSCIIRIP